MRDLVLQAPGRMVTLTGTGGCGKTQLALRVAADLVDTFRDGVWLVDLAPTPAAGLVPYTVATVLGRRERAGETLTDTIVTYLEARELLLVLDNCEHLIDACAALAERVLSGCPQVRLLATSRERLRIGREAAWRVPSLASPDGRADITPVNLMKYPAVRLFVERAQAVQSGFSLGPGNATATAEICARLEGLPLALELAAARVSALALSQILERLDDSFRLLVGGSRTAPTRQQTLRATLDWSFGLLSAVEQVAFSRLVVFAGGWSLEAAEAVCSDEVSIPRTDMLELLSHLIDKSLVVVDERDGRARYRLLEPLRQYGMEYLRAAGDWTATRRRHAVFFHVYALAHERDASVGGLAREAATQALADEYSNLQAALQWCIDAGEAQLGLEIAWGLQFLWKSRGPFGEGVLWIKRLLALPDAAESTQARAVALVTAGRLESLRGNRAAARAFFAEGVPLSRQSRDAWILFVALADSGFEALMRGDYGDAREAFEEALLTTRSSGDRVAEALALNNLGQLATWQGDCDTGAKLSGEALRLARVIGDPFALSTAKQGAGWAALGAGNIADARALAEENLQSDVISQALSLEILGLAALMEREHAEAGARLADALRLRREIGTQGGIAWLLDSVAALAADRGRTTQALRLAGAAETLRYVSETPLHPMRGAWQARWLLPLERNLAAKTIADLLAHGRALPPNEAVSLALAEAQLAIESASESTPGVRAGSTDVLTPRQQEVAALVAQGLTNRQIAERLVVTERAAAAHIEHILNKLRVSSRAQIAVWASKRGLLTTHSD